MKNLILTLSLIIGFIPIYAQEYLENTFPIKKGQSLALDFAYAEKIIVHLGQENIVKLKILLDFADSKGNSLNDRFKVIHKSSGKEMSINGKLSNFNANQVVSKRRAHTKKNDKKTIITDTVVEVWVPEGVDLNIKSLAAAVDIEHNKASLLVNTINNINLNLDKEISANFSLSSLMGKINLDRDWEVNLDKFPTDKSFQMDIVTKDTSFSIHAGEQRLSLKDGKFEISLKTITGNIKITTNNFSRN